MVLSWIGWKENGSKMSKLVKKGNFAETNDLTRL